MKLLVVVVVVVVLAVQLISAPPVPALVDCGLATPDTPVFFTMAVGVSPGVTIMADCNNMCMRLGYSHAGISEGLHCLCSSTFTVATSATCDVTCGTDECGAEDNNVLAIYDTGGGSPNFTMVVNDTSDVALTLDPDATGASFLVDMDVDSPLSYVTTTSLSSDPFIPPGSYRVRVMSMIEGTSLTAYDEANLTVKGIPAVDEVSCPVVWEPDEVYYCNVSVTVEDEQNTFTATFDDDGSVFTIACTGTEIYRLGTPPPRGLTREVAAPGSSTDWISKRVPILRASELLAYDMYAYVAGTVEVEITRPTCASGTYSVDVGGCMAVPSDDVMGTTHTCDAGIFWPQHPTCSDAAGAAVAEEAPATWATVPGTDAVLPLTEGFYRHLLPAPANLMPGDVIRILGAVGKSPWERTGGDMVNDVETTSHHYISAIVKEKVPVQVSHTCTTVGVDVGILVEDVNAVAVALDNHTSCERNITDIMLVISQTTTDLFDEIINEDGPYFIRSLSDANFTFVFSVAGPAIFTLTYDPSIGANSTFNETGDFPLGPEPHNLTKVLQMSDDDMYNITVYAANQHNLETGPITNITILYVQHEVVTTWTVSSESPQGFLIPAVEDATVDGVIRFTDTGGTAPFPTNASADVDWGDGTVETLSFEDPGDQQPVLQHPYASHGYYNISAYIYNNVSGFKVACEILILEAILDFEIKNIYYPTPSMINPRDGMGRDKNEYPIDKNLTFIPSMKQGTVDRYEVYNDSSSELMLTFTVEDRFYPLVNYFHYSIPYETFVNMTVIAINALDSSSVKIFVEIVGDVKGCDVDDFSEVMPPNEEKTFLVSFESVGGGTCLVVHWGDGDADKVDTFGVLETCLTKYAGAPFHDDPLLDVFMNVTHTYTESKTYNVTIYAFNERSFCSQRIMTYVTELACKPPKVSIEEGSKSPEIPMTFVRSKAANIYTIASLDCDLSSNTKKRWQLYRANETGELEAYLPTMYVIPTWNRAHVSIPALHLEVHRMYLAWYTLTILDTPADFVFQKRTMTYFEILATPLVPIMMENSVSKVIRGLTQTLVLQPGILSMDPDSPDNKDFIVEWRCRKVEEEWPDPDDTPKPMEGSGSDGCFGSGPGLFSHTGKELTLLGSQFVASNQVYEFMATVSKDVRTASVVSQVEIVPYEVPVIVLECASEVLCRPDGDGEGVFINPSSRMAIKSKCIEACYEPLTYMWISSDVDDNAFPHDDAYFPLGFEEEEVVFSTVFFDDYPDLTQIRLSVSVTNDDGRAGTATYFMKVNKRPENGICDVTGPDTRLALVDHYTLSCEGWTDPENIGITTYVVTITDADDITTTLLEMRHIAADPQVEAMVFPPGVFTFKVQVFDEWGAFTIYTKPEQLEVLMPSKEDVDNATIGDYIDVLIGTGDHQMLQMVLLAQNKVIQNASWLSLEEKDVEIMSDEELEARLIELADMNNEALAALQDIAPYNTIANVNIATGITSSIMDFAQKNEYTLATIDSDARIKIMDILEDVNKDVADIDIATPLDLVPLVTYIASINMAMGKSQDEFGNKQDGVCKSIPSDVRKQDSFDYNTELGEDALEFEKQADPGIAVDCHLNDVTRERAATMIPVADEVLEELLEKVLKLNVVGELHDFATTNGVYVKLGILKRKDIGSMDIGTAGSKVAVKEDFCPPPNCTGDKPFGFALIEWPVTLYSFTKTAKNLSPGTKVIDFTLYNRKVGKLAIENLPDDEKIEVTIAKTYSEGGNTSLPAMTMVNAVKASKKRSIPVMYSTFNITSPDCSVSLDILPETFTDRLFLLIDKPRLPTLKKNMKFIMVKDLEKVDDMYKLVLLAKDLAGLGRYFVGIGEFKDTFDIGKMNDPEKNSVNLDVVKNMTTDYEIRITVNGAAFLNKTTKRWESKGVTVTKTTETLTVCETDHLTSFGAGMFVMPNTIDFNYVFANMGFTDNLTIYLTLIISLSIFLILIVWAYIRDKKDVEKLGAAPLPDNRIEDKYLYEILVFTGNTKGAQTDSIVQFTLCGEDDETDVRTLGDSKRKILRKADVDVFVMAVPRPLGQLQFLRIWHDNSGKGTNASWYLSYVVFRDVQTGDKYEFIANQWFAVEWEDGQIDRVLPVAGHDQKRAFRHLFKNTSNKNIADSHLWFSVFLRPPRSRFTRCQRVASCFALLFLSMLVNAMWYDRVPEQPGAGGLQLGPFSFSPEQIGVGVMSNLIVFPPSFLIVFLFRKARPRVLRKSRIEQAVQRTRLSKRPGSTSSTHSQLPREQPKDLNPDTTNSQPQSLDPTQTHDSNYKRVIEKKEKKKKFTLPWWFALIAWLLVFICIVVSVFFLLMYGIMFGNSKATKWITSLIISFFSSVLFIQPLKIFLMAMFMSAIFKSGNLDEDDADEDEEDPLLEQDEAWLHNDGRHRRTLHHNKVDEDTLEILRKARKKEIEMWEILKEIFAYSCFLWIFLIITYGNRDPNAYLLQMNLRNSFIHEGNLDGIDFTKVTNTDRLWFYLFNGLLHPLRAQRTYNGKPPYGLRGFLNDHCNRIMGYATIRQIRVRDNTCRVPSVLSIFGRNCSGYTSLINEESRHFCAGWVLPTKFTANSTACLKEEFRYSTASELNSLPIWGARDWYGGGGYVIHLKARTDDIIEKFHELQRNHWIDRKTRAVIIEFSAYNSQVNLFGLSLIMAEFTPGGGITPNFRFEGIRLLQHHDNFGLFIIGCEVIFVLFVLYFTGREFYLFYKQRFSYFSNYWSYAEISIIVASYSAIIIYAVRYVATKKVLTVFNRTFGNGYVKLQYAASLDEMYGYVVGFIVFVGTLKFIKLLRFNKRMGVLSATLRQCWDDLSGFLMAFFLCFFTFVAMFYLLLNQYLLGFYNFITAVETCFSMMLGKFQFEEMKQASYVVPVMFFVFVLCNSWVLINLLLTLIIRSFTQVKHDIMNQPNEYEMVAFVWGRFRAFLGMGGPSQVSPTLNTTKEAKEEEAQENQTVQEFPNKVDKFLDYLNATYFDGTLDVSSKDALKSSMYRNSASRERSGRYSARYSE